MPTDATIEVERLQGGMAGSLLGQPAKNKGTRLSWIFDRFKSR
jgi:hypothetical protein